MDPENAKKIVVLKLLKKDFGFCHKPHKCLECSVNEICEKNFDKKIKVKRPSRL